MRIVQVTPRYPPRTGGVETHVSEISERLVDRGHEVTVLTADAGSDVESRETREGVEIHRHWGPSPGSAYHFAPGIVPAVHRAGADVVHAHNYHSLPVLLGALGVADQRFVVTPHYHGGSASPTRARLLSLYRPIGRWALGRADEVIAVSEWERTQLDVDFGVDATVVPNGVDLDRFAGVEPEKRQRPYLLCVGRLTEYKGVQHAIRALVDLPEFDLLVAGDGPQADELRALATATSVTSRVEFLGHVDESRLSALYAGAEAHLVLSSFEAYGLTVAEALAAGTPCVVREAGALQDWIDDRAVRGVATIEPATVAEAVRGAVGTTVDVSLPTWETAVDELLRHYAGDDRPR